MGLVSARSARDRVDRLTPLLRIDATPDGEHRELTLPSINRRGRPVQVNVTVSPLRADVSGEQGLLVVMDPRRD